MATLFALLASCAVAFVVGGDLAADAASSGDVVLSTVLFSGWCFVLAWPAAFLLGWLWLRRRDASGPEEIDE